jgi:hypothetical protein
MILMLLATVIISRLRQLLVCGNIDECLHDNLHYLLPKSSKCATEGVCRSIKVKSQFGIESSSFFRFSITCISSSLKRDLFYIVLCNGNGKIAIIFARASIE